jgi:BMFP domain-containing protein YqiC
MLTEVIERIFWQVHEKMEKQIQEKWKYLAEKLRTLCMNVLHRMIIKFL